jgi:hypothetical protein
MKGRSKVVLRGVPVALGERARRHWEGMRRELALMTYADGATKSAPPSDAFEFLERYRRNVDVMVLSSSAFEHAQRRGDAHTDVEVELPPESLDSLRRIGELLDGIDDFARTGAMLTTPSPPECVELRRWITGEIARQARGEQPRPWNGPLS